MALAGRSLCETAQLASSNWWAFCALSHSLARALYDTRRAESDGDGHDHALRALANRLVGILHGCPRTHTPYDEATAWPATTATAVRLR